MVRDEHDVVAHVLRHLLGEGVDHIIVADNRSADSTAQIVADVGRNSPVPPVRDSNRAYFRTEKMTRLARAAFLRGASWVIPFDADEIWTAPGTGLAQFLRSSQDDVIFARIFDHVPTPTDRAPAAEPNPFIRLQHRTVEPTGLAKVAFRASLLARLHMGNHDVDRSARAAKGWRSAISPTALPSSMSARCVPEAWRSPQLICHLSLAIIGARLPGRPTGSSALAGKRGGATVSSSSTRRRSGARR